jgi:hypothetical protein
MHLKALLCNVFKDVFLYYDRIEWQDTLTNLEKAPILHTMMF